MSMFSNLGVILTQDPTLSYLKNEKGTAVCNVNARCHTGYGENRKTIWLRLTIFGKSAEAANQYLRKGSGLYINADLRAGDDGNPRTFTRKDGTAGASFELTVHDWTFPVGGNSGANNDADVAPDAQTQAASVDDDIPF